MFADWAGSFSGTRPMKQPTENVPAAYLHVLHNTCPAAGDETVTEDPRKTKSEEILRAKLK